MNHKRPPLPALIVLALVVILGAYFIISQAQKNNGRLTASGFIEAIQVNISPELAGKVSEVLVEEGQPVKAGDPLLRLDPSLLNAQRQIAQSGLDSAKSALLTAQSAYALAQAQYDAALLAARAQEGSARLTDWAQRAPGRFDQPLWYFTRAEQIAAAQASIESARQAVQQAQSDLDKIVQDLASADFLAAENRLAEARMNYLIAKAVYDHAQLTGGKIRPEDIQADLPPFVPAYRVKIKIAKTLSGESDVITAASDALDAAESELDSAQQAYDELLTTTAAEQVLKARAALSVAEEHYQVALDMWSRLQTGEHSPQVRIAAAARDQAQAALQQAESAVRQAEANLSLLDTQMDKLTIVAPSDGMILTRSVEVGEFVQPGATLFVLGQLGDLTITVYIPEDRYGQIHVGQQAEVSVDSFPGMTFTATVIQISDQAEFTPRNVQTVEGRSTTVYAVKLRLENGQDQLKIGMPADVAFK